MARSLALVLMLLSHLALLQQVSAGYVLYKDRHQPVKLRVADLLKRMTLDEKIGQMTQIERSVANASDIKQYKIGPNLPAPRPRPWLQFTSTIKTNHSH